MLIGTATLNCSHFTTKCTSFPSYSVAVFIHGAIFQPKWTSEDILARRDFDFLCNGIVYESSNYQHLRSFFKNASRAGPLVITEITYTLAAVACFGFLVHPLRWVLWACSPRVDLLTLHARPSRERSHNKSLIYEACLASMFYIPQLLERAGFSQELVSVIEIGNWRQFMRDFGKSRLRRDRDHSTLKAQVNRAGRAYLKVSRNSICGLWCWPRLIITPFAAHGARASRGAWCIVTSTRYNLPKVYGVFTFAPVLILLCFDLWAQVKERRNTVDIFVRLLIVSLPILALLLWQGGCKITLSVSSNRSWRNDRHRKG